MVNNYVGDGLVPKLTKLLFILAIICTDKFICMNQVITLHNNLTSERELTLTALNPLISSFQMEGLRLLEIRSGGGFRRIEAI